MDTETKQHVIEILSRISILKSFSAAEIKEKFFKKGLARVRGFGADETIISEGNFDNWVYWLVKGKIDVYKNNLKIDTLQRVGDMFGEMSVLEGDARSATVVSRTDTVCLAVDMSILDHPDLKDKISKDRFCGDVAQVTKHRLAKTTHRLSKSGRELAETKNKLADMEQKWREAMETLRKTLLKLDEKEKEIRALKKQIKDST